MASDQTSTDRSSNSASLAWTPQADDHGTTSARSFEPRVLLVDDEPRVVEGLRRALLPYRYQVATATSAGMAAQKFAEEPFDVVVSDERMPGMPGSELLSLIAKEYPTTGRILLTGHGTAETAARAINEAGVIRFLLKPCPPEQLHDAIEAALRVTPFEKKVRSGRRRPYLVSQRGSSEATGHTPISSDRAWESQNHAAELHDERTVADRVEWQANELVLQAQNVIELAHEMLFGYEISSRLHSRDGNVHTIGNFLSRPAQRISLSAVDRWVVRHVMRVVRAHKSTLERRALTVSLNIAAQSLTDPEFVRFLDKELLDPRVAARFLIEVRESPLAKCVRRDEDLLANLLSMKCYSRGARLCIDGVGGALWKLAVLDDLPVAVAKIDSRFVCDILTNRESESLVRCAVDWGQSEGVAIAATGVDTPAIAERLRSLGVRFGQGSAYGTPEPISAALATLYC
jgi:EAL domain-containing protein (putative c-di-GMP-specific phosphodiesterase class I)/DNA-binding NarL/FixJ family response regulator